jgi:hypothetical protein
MVRSSVLTSVRWKPVERVLFETPTDCSKYGTGMYYVLHIVGREQQNVKVMVI